MNGKINNPQPLVIRSGFTSSQNYEDYATFKQSMSNYNHQCPYQLDSNAFHGYHQILQLYNIQISYAKRKGSTMHTAITAKDCLIISLVGEDTDKACFGHRKVKTGDILFFDDTNSNIFMAKNAIEFTAITIPKNLLGVEFSKLLKLINYHIKDIDSKLSTILNETMKKREQNLEEAERKIMTVIMQLLSEQTPLLYKLTSGEKTAFKICDYIFHNMYGKISIDSLVKQHQTTKQTLSVSFKSLFGFTPQLFLRLLRLNHIHHELSQNNKDNTTVSSIASKWGFTHMGRFSSYYYELFKEQPSQTLNNSNCHKQTMVKECVLKQEEL